MRACHRLSFKVLAACFIVSPLVYIELAYKVQEYVFKVVSITVRESQPQGQYIVKNTKSNVLNFKNTYIISLKISCSLFFEQL
jgi:hypothetical protein